ncbi:MAG: epoxyqueuosine reductase QueH [Endozoicomonadaceae bacterium]|nr:epoxyqueuosine reductase QueH [Endozoicomonadaceae bacterium]
MTQHSLSHYQRPILETPKNEKEILLHSCCAPCAGEIILAIQASNIKQTIFFYNPNIHPKQEYEMRKNENKRFCDAHHIEFIDADYDTDNWFERIKGFENEPERGKRCTLCFDMRFERTALQAHESNINLISSTLGISRWKNMEQINASGTRAANRYDHVVYWIYNWRKQGGAPRMIELAKAEQFYQQEYCGCVYSLRDTNQHRLKSGKERIKRLVKFYTEDPSQS